jgi:indolepyruvate ferredoxin oxidoreductase
MAYKDEYEVARLVLKSSAAQQITDLFGPDARQNINLHPPILRDRGLKNKLELGAWFRPLLGGLIPMRRLRGTPFDLFGRTPVRRAERDLITWYLEVIDGLLEGLTPRSYKLAVQIASTPDRIRGYENIKLRSITVVKDFVDGRLKEYRALRPEDRTTATAG